jgi:cytochrome b pre-mRNA-processing protein 3
MAGWWRRLFGRRERQRLLPLYEAVVAVARRPAWYRDGAVPDTLDGRFDMVAAILSLVLLRLEQDGAAGRAPSAYLAELFVDDMDGQLRQAGIGDIVVGKHIGRMMAALGGRLGAFRDGFSTGEIETAIDRNIYRGAEVEQPARDFVAGEIGRLRRGLADRTIDQLLAGDLP